MNNAFPSGHAVVVFAAAYLLNFFYGPKMRWTYGIAVWVALTRIYVGVHYPTDLLGGGCVGSICALLTAQGLRFWLAHHDKTLGK